MKLRSQGRGRRRKQRRRRRRRRSKRKKLGKEPWRDLAAFILHFTVRSGAIRRFFFPPSLFLIFRSTFSLFLHFSLSLSLSPLNSFFFPSFSASSEIESVTPTRSIKRPASNSSAETNDVPSVNFRLFCRVLVFLLSSLQFPCWCCGCGCCCRCCCLPFPCPSTRPQSSFVVLLSLIGGYRVFLPSFIFVKKRNQKAKRSGRPRCSLGRERPLTLVLFAK